MAYQNIQHCTLLLKNIHCDLTFPGMLHCIWIKIMMVMYTKLLLMLCFQTVQQQFHLVPFFHFNGFNVWENEWINMRMNQWMINKQTNEWVSEQMNEWLNERMAGWMNECIVMNRPMDWILMLAEGFDQGIRVVRQHGFLYPQARLTSQNSGKGTSLEWLVSS